MSTGPAGSTGSGGDPQASDAVAAKAGNPAEIERLRAENARLKQSVAESKLPRNWGRTVGATVLILVACLLAPLSVVAVWARGEVTDTERYVATVAPLASDPAIQDAAATRITNEIFQYVDVQELTTEAVDTISANRSLTPRQQAALTALTGPVTSGIESFVGDKVNEVVESDAFATAWTEANYAASQKLNAALSGEDNGALEINGDTVSLNLGDVVATVKQRLIDRGFTVAEKIPAVDAQLVLFQSDKISRAQTAYSALNTVGFWMPFIVAALALIGVLVANNRRKAFIWLGAGLLAGMVLAAIALAIGQTVYMNELPDSANPQAAEVLFETLTDFLRQALRAGAVGGLVLILGGVFTGPNVLGASSRRLASRSAAGVQRGLASIGASMDPARAWVASQATTLRIVATVIALGVVLITRYKTVGLVLWTTAGLLVALFIIQIFASGADKTEGEGDSVSDDSTPATA